MQLLRIDVVHWFEQTARFQNDIRRFHIAREILILLFAICLFVWISSSSEQARMLAECRVHFWYARAHLRHELPIFGPPVASVQG